MAYSPSLSVSIVRSSLSLPALVIGDTRSVSGFWLQREGIGRPSLTKHRTYAAQSPFLNGELLVRSTAEQSNQPLAFYGTAATMTDLYDLMGQLEAALDQFVYDMTITEGGVARKWTCDPADITWGDIDPDLSNALIVSGAVTIPVYPVAS